MTIVSDDRVNLELKDLLGDEEIGIRTLKDRPLRKNKVGPKQRQH